MTFVTVEEEKLAIEAGTKTLEWLMKYQQRFSPSYMAMAVVQDAIKAIERKREETTDAERSGN